ncbi:MAG: hypothetical protein ACE5LS_08350, partial [Thermoplasmata archaeon]
MRGFLLAFLLSALISGTAFGQPVSDPEKTNLILTIHRAPQLAPGERSAVELELHNPYTWSMENTSLFGEVYAFVHRSE